MKLAKGIQKNLSLKATPETKRPGHEPNPLYIGTVKGIHTADTRSRDEHKKMATRYGFPQKQGRGGNARFVPTQNQSTLPPWHSVALKTAHATRYNAGLFFRNPDNVEAEIVVPSVVFLTYLRSLGERVIVLRAHPRHIGTTALHHD